MSQLNEYIAGLLSSAAYTPASVGQALFSNDQSSKSLADLGWEDITEGLQSRTNVNFYDGELATNGQPSTVTNEFRVFSNEQDHQIVFAFKGSDATSNWVSDLKIGDFGYSEYKKISDAAKLYYTTVSELPQYAGCEIFADGHSLGGGMAQCFALTEGISGYGQNSLPITPGFIQDFTGPGGFASALATYQQSQTVHFNEFNDAGDIATFTYSSLLSSSYLDVHPDEISSPYGAALKIALGLAVIPFLTPYSISAALAIGGKAHLIGSYIPLVLDWRPSLAETPLTVQQAATLKTAINSLNTGHYNDDQSLSLSYTDGTGKTVFVPQPTGTTPTPIGGTFAENAGGQYGPILFGGDKATTLIGNGTNGFMVAGTGDTSVIGGSGNSTLVGGLGNATLVGGAGTDQFEYIVSQANQSTKTIISDSVGNGSVWIGNEAAASNIQLHGGKAVAGQNFTWLDAVDNSTRYVFSPAVDGKTGTLTISQGQLGTNGAAIVINNFDLNAAETSPDGFLGIKFVEQAAFALTSAPSPFANGATAAANVTMVEAYVARRQNRHKQRVPVTGALSKRSKLNTINKAIRNFDGEITSHFTNGYSQMISKNRGPIFHTTIC